LEEQGRREAAELLKAVELEKELGLEEKRQLKNKKDLTLSAAKRRKKIRT